MKPLALMQKLARRPAGDGAAGEIRLKPRGFALVPNYSRPAEPAAPLLPDTLGRIGALELRLARKGKEIRRAQRLRYKVFYEEMSAVPGAAALLARRDMDAFDPICDHILVLDHAAPKKNNPLLPRKKPKVVGTYRLLRQEVADRHFGFYTQGEFDLAPLIERRPDLKFLELGRSCVEKTYRDKRSVELLWHGIWAYVLANGVDVMVGCASLEGTDPQALALPLSYLHHFHKAPPEWHVKAHPGRATAMDLLPKDAIDPKKALRALPPLIKGYLRLGAYIGEGAVIDHQFGTTDIFIVMPVAAINPRYVNYYGADAGRHAA